MKRGEVCSYCKLPRDWRCVWHLCAPERRYAKREGGVPKSHKRKVKILIQQGGLCWLCGKPCADDMTLEHIQPKAMGGTNALTNLAVTHRACNLRLGCLPPSEKYKMRKEMRGAQV